jgi:hypothetical protein
MFQTPLVSRPASKAQVQFHFTHPGVDRGLSKRSGSFFCLFRGLAFRRATERI